MVVIAAIREGSANEESIAPIFSSTRGELQHNYEQRLNRTIDSLKTQGGDSKEVGDILEKGQTLLKKYLKMNSDHSTEIVALYKVMNIHSPYQYEFEKPPKVLVGFDGDWMNYSDTSKIEKLNRQNYNVTFVNFANSRLGGYWTTGGNLQEERIVQQCPDFPLLLSSSENQGHDSIYLTRKKSNKPAQTRTDPAHLISAREDKNHDLSEPGDDSADPILIVSMRCLQKLRRDHTLESLLEAPPRVNFIAMAAPELNLRNRDEPYTAGVLHDLYNNAFTGFKLAKLYDSNHKKKTHLISGRWGAGAFGHHPMVSIAVQYLAAELVGVEHLEFTGMTAEEGSPAIESVQHLISDAYSEASPTKKISAETLLLKLLKIAEKKGWEFNPSKKSPVDDEAKTFKVKTPPLSRKKAK